MTLCYSSHLLHYAVNYQPYRHAATVLKLTLMQLNYHLKLALHVLHISLLHEHVRLVLVRSDLSHVILTVLFLLIILLL
jgi:hypothetical protein